MNRHKTYLGLGLLLILSGIVMPQGWYNPLPQREVLPPPPVSGFLLLQISIALQGATLLWLGFRRWQFATIEANCRLSLPAVAVESPGPRRFYTWPLAAVTLLGLALRLVSLNSDLWLDEITPILNYRNASMWQVAISYISSNNHLLNTLLVKLCVSIFGEQEWAIRLPAVIFGTATIPAIYWVSRQVLSRRASECVALLLAVSYHHIFFSQNARAYTAYVLFSLLSSALFVKALHEDRARVWVWYVLTTVLNFASILISGFVFAAHILVGCLALFWIRSRGGSPTPLLKRLIGVFTIIGFLGFQLYAAVLPQMYVYMHSVYTDPSAGFSPFSAEFLVEIARGVSAGFGTGLLFGAIPFLIIAGVGYLVLLRRNWPLIVGLTAPGVLKAALLIVLGLVFSPRFFILVLPLAILVAVQGIDNIASFGARILKRSPAFSYWLSVGLVLLLSTLSLASLPPYYAVPKQAYRSSLEYVETTRNPNDIVIVIHLAEPGYRYYGERYGIHEGKDYFDVRSVAALDEVLSKYNGRRSWLVITFPRALRKSFPDLEARIKQSWIVAKEFPGTVGDGDISVWQMIAISDDRPD
ncbi:MAG: glycosyltransferase family 39 protein [Gemmatimonadaceae bacterium]